MLRLIMYACCMGYGYGREKYRTGNDGTNSSSIKKDGTGRKVVVRGTTAFVPILMFFQLMQLFLPSFPVPNFHRTQLNKQLMYGC